LTGLIAVEYSIEILFFDDVYELKVVWRALKRCFKQGNGSLRKGLNDYGNQEDTYWDCRSSSAVAGVL
jgi:hypothetical protein